MWMALKRAVCRSKQILEMANEVCHEHGVAGVVQVNSVPPVYSHRATEVIMPHAAHAHITEERVHHLVHISPGLIDASRCTTSPMHPNSAFTEVGENNMGPREQRHHQHKITPDLVDELSSLGVTQIVCSTMNAQEMRCIPLPLLRLEQRQQLTPLHSSPAEPHDIAGKREVRVPCGPGVALKPVDPRGSYDPNC